MKLAFIVIAAVFLSLASLALAGGGNGSAIEQPIFDPLLGINVNIQDTGDRNIAPDFGDLNELDILMGFIDPVIFRKIGDPQEELLPLCPDIDKMVDKVMASFEEEDFQTMCSDVQNSADQCKNAAVDCDSILELSSRNQALTCPPDEERLFTACKNRLLGQLANADTLSVTRCGEWWDSHATLIEEQCKLSELEEVHPTGEVDVTTQTPECPEPFKPFTCQDGSQALTSGQRYPFDSGLTCELYTCPNQTTTAAEPTDECPPAPTCNVGTPVASGTFQKASGSICPQYECVVVSNTTTAQTASAAKITGLATQSTASTVASTPSVNTPYCTKEGFMENCAVEFKEEAQYAVDNIDDKCSSEASEFADYLENYCSEDDVGDPYEMCIEQARETCNRITTVFDKCKSVANREGLRPVLERKAKIECARHALREQNDEYENVVSTLEALDIEGRSREDIVQVAATRNQIVLTTDELERIKQEIKTDVLRDLMVLLGLNTGHLTEVAQKQKLQLENLKAARDSVQEICHKVTENDKTQCAKAIESLNGQIESLEREITTNEARAGGLFGIIANILRGK